MSKLTDYTLRNITLSKYARDLDAQGIYRPQFEYLYNVNSDIVGQEPIGQLYKEWLNIIVQSPPPKTADFDAVTFGAFDTLRRRRISEEDYLAKRPTSTRESSLPEATEALDGKSWLALAQAEKAKKQGANFER
jgi:hypothetical protein